MTARLVALVIDATAPAQLAGFWARALRWDVADPEPGDGGAVQLVPGRGVGDPTSFRLHVRPGAGEKTGQNRIHFDLTTTSLDDQRGTVADLIAHGASHADVGQDPNDTHVVLADPDGNELCVIEPTNRFLSTCPRLGAVNCDGTHALGEFFSAALGWPLVWDEGEETAIQAPDGTGPKITWSGPPLMPTPGHERFHFHLAPSAGASTQDTLEHLLGLGATRLEPDRACPGAVALADVDGNRICLLPA